MFVRVKNIKHCTELKDVNVSLNNSPLYLCVSGKSRSWVECSVLLLRLLLCSFQSSFCFRLENKRVCECSFLCDLWTCWSCLRDCGSPASLPVSCVGLLVQDLTDTILSSYAYKSHYLLTESNRAELKLPMIPSPSSATKKNIGKGNSNVFLFFAPLGLWLCCACFLSFEFIPFSFPFCLKCFHNNTVFCQSFPNTF